MIELLLIPALSLLNRAAGWNAVEDYQKKHGLDTYAQAWAECPAWMRWAVRLTGDGLVAGYIGTLVHLSILAGGNYTNRWDCIILPFAVFAGWWLWRGPGWGPMFHAFNGRPYVGTGKLSRFVGRFLGDYSEAAATVYGCLRGLLGMLPLAAGLAMLGHPGAGVALLAAGACMGVVYWLGGAHQRATGRDAGVKISECLMGALIGAALAGVI